MALFRNKYRVESARLTVWDYSTPGYYFVTVCTNDRKCILSEIKDGTVILTPIGEIVKEEWERTGSIRKNVSIHEFVIMPNHLHGIVQIESQNPVETPWHGVSTTATGVSTTATGVSTMATGVSTMAIGVSTNNIGNTAKSNSKPSNWKTGVLGAIIGQFKIQATKRTRHSGFSNFQWQPRFHDHIIRDNHELFRIRQYIRDNPANWDDDEQNPWRKSPRYVAMPNAQRQ
jgi:putative transposase